MSSSEPETPKHRDPQVLRRLYHDEGLTQTEIGEQLGVNPSVISRSMSNHDIEVEYNRSRRKDHQKDAETLREMYHKNGMTQAEIGEEFGVSSTTIKRWMDDLGLDTRRVRKEDVVIELRRLHDELERIPTQRDMHKHGKHSLNSGRRKFGSWNDALEAAGFERYDATGERNPNWNGGFEKYYGPNWKEQRTEAIVRDQARCRDCGMTESESVEWFGYKLDVHHIEPLKSYKANGSINFEQANQLQNLVSLCRSCHQERERRD